MSLKAMNCPSCGADITLDDDREFGFCSYCGSRIQIGDRVNIHVTHEFKGETPQVNVTNQYFYNEQDDKENNDYRPNIIVEKPNGKKLGWGIALAIIGVMGLFGSGGKEISYIAICLLMIVIAVLLLISYYKAMQVYNEAIRNASKNGGVFKEKKGRRK